MIDITKNYIVHPVKNEHGPIDMEKVIQKIYAHIQNNPIYFSYEPKMYKGVLIFGVVGFNKNHSHLEKHLGKALKKMRCLLTSVKTE